MKSNTKKGFIFALICSSTLIFVLSILDKIGYRKYFTYLSPISWWEYFCRIPYYIGFTIILFCIIFSWWIFIRREPKYCIFCKKLIPRSISDDSFCPECKKPTEPLDGVYERHPELKD